MIQLLVSHFTGWRITTPEYHRRVDPLVGPPEKRFDHIRYLSDRTAETRRQNLEELMKALRKVPILTAMKIWPYLFAWSEGEPELIAHLKPTKLDFPPQGPRRMRLATSAESHDLNNDKGLGRKGEDAEEYAEEEEYEQKFLDKDSPIVRSHNKSLA
jgi:hypothetical protein